MDGKSVAQGGHPLPSLSATAPFPTDPTGIQNLHTEFHTLRIKEVCHHPPKALKSRRLPLNIQKKYHEPSEFPRRASRGQRLQS